MLLMLHILAGLVSVGASLSRAILLDKINLKRGHVAASLAVTLISGTGLLFMSPGALTHLCISGFVLTSTVLALEFVASKRILARAI